MMPSSTPQSRRRTASPTRVTAPTARIATSGRPLGNRHDLCEVDVVDPVKIGRARAAVPDGATLARLAETLRALGDPTRLRIVCALAAPGVDELCVCDLTTLVDVSNSAVSHSLRTLRELGIVRYRKAGKIAYYSVDDAHVAELVREGLRHVARADDE